MDFGQWAVGAVMVVGVLQWLKNIVPKTAPKWLYVALLPVVSVGVALLPVGGILWGAALAFALAQLGYETIIQTVKKKLGA